MPLEERRELAREQVTQPALEQRHHAAQEEEPHAPARRPEAAAGALAHRARVEAVVDQVLQVLAHADLAHQPVLVPVHARELPHVREDVLQPVGELVGVHVAEAVLDVRVDDELREAQDLTAQVEGVTEARLLALLGGERLDGLEVEVVVEVQVVDVLAMDEQVQHVVALPADLQAGLDPVELRALEELGALERLEEVLLLLDLGRLAVELVGHPALEQLLVRDAHLYGVARGAVLHEPRLHEGHVDAAARVAGAHVEGPRRPVESDGARGLLVVQVGRVQQRLELCRQVELVAVAEVLLAQHLLGCCAQPVRRDGVDDRVEVEGGQVRVLVLDEAACGHMVARDAYVARPRVEQVREGELVLGPDRRADDDLVDVVELVPVVVLRLEVAVEGLELGPAGDGHVERLGRHEGGQVEEVEVVLVRQVRDELRRQPVQVGHHGQR